MALDTDAASHVCAFALVALSIVQSIQLERCSDALAE